MHFRMSGENFAIMQQLYNTSENSVQYLVSKLCVAVISD